MFKKTKKKYIYLHFWCLIIYKTVTGIRAIRYTTKTISYIPRTYFANDSTNYNQTSKLYAIQDELHRNYYNERTNPPANAWSECLNYYHYYFWSYIRHVSKIKTSILTIIRAKNTYCTWIYCGYYLHQLNRIKNNICCDGW